MVLAHDAPPSAAPTSLAFAAPVDLTFAQAAAGKPDPLPTFEMVAYTGGAMNVGFFMYPVVVDLAGMAIQQPRPILLEHDRTQRVGHSSNITNDGKGLAVAGTVSGTGPAAKAVVADAKNGFPWQASITASIDKLVLIRKGRTAKANGQTFPGPVYIARKTLLGEISFVALGADQKTTASVAARLARERTSNMNPPETDAQEIRQAERDRLASIEATCQGDWGKSAKKVAELKAKAIAGDIDDGELSRSVLEILRAQRPKVPAIHDDHRTSTPDILVASLLMKCGHEALAEKTFQDPTLEAAHRRHSHMMDFVEECLIADGKDPTSYTRRGRVEAALSTISLPNALGAGAEKILLDSYNETPGTWRSFCKKVPVPNFHEHTLIRPSWLGQLEQVGAGGEVKHARVGEETATIQAATFGKVLGISRNAIINDSLGVFADASRALGRAAARSLNDTVVTTLLANAGSFFHASNSNLLTGGGSALSVAALTSAITAMRAQRDADSNDLDIVPRVLLTPPELENTGRTILNSTEISAPEGAPRGNALRDVVKLEVESRLSNDDKFDNASSTGWYLFAGPADSPMAVCFIDGKETPTIETMGLDHQVDSLTYSWRVIFDFGAALIDSRAAVRNNGA